MLKGQHLSLTFGRGHTQSGVLAIPSRLDGKGIVLWLSKIILQQQRQVDILTCPNLRLQPVRDTDMEG